VDGRTLSSNNQTSWIGEGFDLASGYIERRYIPCLHDMENGATNTIKTGDLCWKSGNAVLSLGGSATELVEDASTGVWRPKRDDASRVQRFTGADNGARDGEYWRVTTADGTRYFFGRHARSAGDTQRTNSVLTVPVAGNHSGEPCHTTSFGSSFCAQAWRWNLDYVVDPNGNTMTHFYTRESNQYGQNRNERSASYHRAGYLSRIDFGQRQGSEHTTPAPGRVVFTVAERCLPSGGITCAPGELTESTADKWPDVPYDRICTSTSSCSERVAPAFFTRKRLTQVETQVRASGSYQPVDRWTLTHAFPEPGDGNSPALWLDRITHSGLAGGTLTLPGVQFSGIPMPNRVPEIDTAPLLAGRYESYRNYNQDGSLRLHWRPGIGGLPQETLWHHYDAAGKPEWLSGARTYVADTRYSPFGEVEQHSLGVDLGRASWQTFFYEEGTRRLQRMRVDREGVNQADVDRVYSYDPAGNPMSIADTGGAGGSDVQCFDYDHQRRLTRAWAQGGTGCAAEPSAGVVGGVAPYWQTYTYSSAGNRTGLTVHGVGGAADTVTSYTHPATGQPGPHRVNSTRVQTGSQPAAVTSYGYDPAGNLTSASGPDGTTGYQWDAHGRLGTVTTPDGTGDAVYTADGARLIRRTPDSTTLYLGGDEYTLNRDTGQVTGTRYYQLGGATLVMRTGGAVSSLATDHQRTPLAVIDQSNQITRRWQDPFGSPRGSQPASWPGDRGFHTGTEDTWAGLVHLGARSYDPGLGQFLSADPLISPGDSQQVHGYSYANHNPLLLTDPAGLEPRPWHNPKFDSKTFDYDQYWANERKAFGCSSCGKSGQRPWSSSSTSSQLSGQHGGNTRARESSRGGSAGSAATRRNHIDQLARGLEAKIERLLVESNLFNMCTATVPDVTGDCQDGARAVAKLYGAALTNAACPPGQPNVCNLPVPDYVSVTLGGKSKSYWFVHVKTAATVTVTRTGKVFSNSTVGVGLGSESRSAKWQPIDVRAGWVYDGERQASDAQVSSYPATGPNAEASLSVSGAGGLVRYEQGMSTHDRGSVHAVEVSITSPSLVDASAGASVSYGSEVADIGPLWR
jgi:RHS repeat-associated protein